MARTKKRVVFRIEVQKLTTYTPPAGSGEKERIENQVVLTQDKDAIDLPAILKAVNGMD